jgi:hypothetical protein
MSLKHSAHLLFIHSPTIPSAPELMGEKKLVTFQMAPRKSSRQGMGKEATMADGWKKIKLSETEISSFVSRQV